MNRILVLTACSLLGATALAQAPHARKEQAGNAPARLPDAVHSRDDFLRLQSEFDAARLRGDEAGLLRVDEKVRKETVSQTANEKDRSQFPLLLMYDKLFGLMDSASLDRKRKLLNQLVSASH